MDSIRLRGGCGLCFFGPTKGLYTAGYRRLPSEFNDSFVKLTKELAVDLINMSEEIEFLDFRLLFAILLQELTQVFRKGEVRWVGKVFPDGQAVAV